MLSLISSLIPSPLIYVLKVNMRFIFSELFFTLVSNIQISRFNIIIYNFCNWSASCNLIPRYTIIFSRDLTCSNFVCLSSCVSPTCCSLWNLDWFKLVTYDVTELEYLELPDLFFTWSSIWIHNWYIQWYRTRIFRRIYWRNFRRQRWGLVARCLTWIICWTCNWF